MTCDQCHAPITHLDQHWYLTYAPVGIEHRGWPISEDWHFCSPTCVSAAMVTWVAARTTRAINDPRVQAFLAQMDRDLANWKDEDAPDGAPI